MESFASEWSFVLKISAAALGVFIVCKIFFSMRSYRRKGRALVILQNNRMKTEIPVLFWENSIGRGRACDIRLDDPAVSRNHAVLFRRKEGWYISDTGSKSGIIVNGEKISGKVRLFIDDVITFGGTSLVLRKSSDSREISSNERAIPQTKPIKPARLLFLVMTFHFLVAVQPWLTSPNRHLFETYPFLIVTVMGWLFLFVSRFVLRRVTFELETLGILLSGLGVLLIGSYKPEEIYMQCGALAIGMLIFCTVLALIENVDSAQRLRLFVIIGIVGLFVVNLLLAKEINGSRNWIFVRGYSLQLSELVKIGYVFAGAASLDQLQTRQNLTGFILLSGVCIGSLFLMKDFGTACVFFAAFIVIAFMRSGSVRTIILSLTAAVFGVFLILNFKPYIKERFGVWGHVFEQADKLGFQQSRVLTYCASGGLVGVGVGNGYLKNIFAAMSDLIFGVVCEEMGLIIAIALACSMAGLALFAKNQSSQSRSTFYSISAGAASTMLLFQTGLHIFGATDTLPLTGITFPFLSLGGSSMVASWGLLAFIKAADERSYALRKG